MYDPIHPQRSWLRLGQLETPRGRHQELVTYHSALVLHDKAILDHIESLYHGIFSCKIHDQSVNNTYTWA